jgi:uncharacterized phage protein (TIGR01671 family)
MSREIKFRAWDKKTERFQSGFHLTSDGKIIFACLVDNEDYILSQFTGLLDANENPIFIGDILSSKEYYNNDLDANYKKVGEVKFNDGYNYFDVGYYLDGFEFKNGKVWRKFRNDLVKAKYDINGNYNLKPISNGGYIVGNIFQNPELIGGEND